MRNDDIRGAFSKLLTTWPVRPLPQTLLREINSLRLTHRIRVIHMPLSRNPPAHPIVVHPGPIPGHPPGRARNRPIPGHASHTTAHRCLVHPVLLLLLPHRRELPWALLLAHGVALGHGGLLRHALLVLLAAP